ncbi:unnamed protein product, partial [Vitis vinifera]|uniref:Uncharacterized protein n=1 Tax=Vitis vinifera TaxID=29760 RepID=D7T185_VITVI
MDPSYVYLIAGHSWAYLRTTFYSIEILDVIVGFDYRDEATRTTSKYKP